MAKPSAESVSKPPGFAASVQRIVIGRFCGIERERHRHQSRLYQVRVESSRGSFLVSHHQNQHRSMASRLIHIVWSAAIRIEFRTESRIDRSDDRQNILIPATCMMDLNGRFPAVVSTACPSGIGPNLPSSRNGACPARFFYRTGYALRQEQPPRNDVCDSMHSR